MKINAASLINDIKGFVDPRSVQGVGAGGRAAPVEGGTAGGAMRSAAPQIIPASPLAHTSQFQGGPNLQAPSPSIQGSTPQLQPALAGKLKLGQVEYHPAVGLHVKVLP